MIRIAPVNHREAAVAAGIHTILRLAYDQEAALLNTDRSKGIEESATEIQAGNQYFLGAFDGDNLVGVLCIAPDDEPDQLSIDTLVVNPSHQRRGIADLLLAEALHRAQGMALSVCTGAANVPALHLYEKSGFVPYRRGTIGPESLALVKLRRSAP